jgi:hypothetical protein
VLTLAIVKMPFSDEGVCEVDCAICNDGIDNGGDDEEEEEENSRWGGLIF